MSSTDGNPNAVDRRVQRLDRAQLRGLAGNFAARSVRPAAALVAVFAAMCLAAQAPATLTVMVVLALVWRRRRRWRHEPADGANPGA
jgi:hypothetical protein